MPPTDSKRKTATEKEISLQDTLNVFFHEEHLTDFKCEKCLNTGDVVIRREFVRLPRVLILHLKRYQYQEVRLENDMEAIFNDIELQDVVTTNTGAKISWKLNKNDSQIKIPRYLTLKMLTCPAASLGLPKPLSLPSPVIKMPFKPLNKFGSPAVFSRTPLSTIRQPQTHQSPIAPKPSSRMPKTEENDFELVDLELEMDSESKYDPKKFIPNDMSETDQMQRALELSLVEEAKPDTSTRPVRNKKRRRNLFYYLHHCHE